ncbi:MAG: hypothetical protein E7385_02070 [Ruminococcaceae bacterium]|nr:hypothetical protein [Oscillospiraceae bacterium]
MTDNLSRIIEKIISEAQDKADEILKDARAQAQQIMEQAAEEAQMRNQEIVSVAQNESQALRTRIESSFNMQKRSSVLSVKQEIIAKAYEQALVHLQGINDVAYLQMLTDFVVKSAGSQSNDPIYLILCEKDMVRAASIVDSCSKALANRQIKLGDKTVNATGGLIVRIGDIMQNYTFEAIIDSIKNDCDIEVSKILFSE